MATSLSQLSDHLISVFEDDEILREDEKKITVNRMISEVVSWYEKLRNAMDYREEEVVLRAAIERILKRRFLLAEKGKSIAEPLVRELIWARYFPDASVPEAILEEVAKTIDLYVSLRQQILNSNKIPESIVTEWTYHLMSADLAELLSPTRDRHIISSFMFQVVKQNVTIIDDSEQTRDAQVFIAIRKAFAKDDIAFLRFYLFKQFFGELSETSLNGIALRFTEGYKEIERQLDYPLRNRIFNYIKKQVPPFFILEDLLKKYKGELRTLLENQEEFDNQVLEGCEGRYKTIAVKIQRAVLRSFIFILFTKALFAVGIEGTYESLLYGEVLWGNIAINALVPPLLMVGTGIMIKPPTVENSKKILARIKSLLTDEQPKLGPPLELSKSGKKKRGLMDFIFGLLWFIAFGTSFGLIIWILGKLQFNPMSQVVFIFFVAVVSFLTYRINNTANEYTVEYKQGFITPIIDFFFMPIVHVGRHLSEGISQINILLFLLDFIIETPFKGIFGFFEQLFLYLHTKRENLG